MNNQTLKAVGTVLFLAGLGLWILLEGTDRVLATLWRDAFWAGAIAISAYLYGKQNGRSSIDQ